MVFHSFSYLLFFPIVFFIYFVLPSRIRYLWLLAASYFFYMRTDFRYLSLLVTITLFSYGSGIAIEWSKTHISSIFSKGILVFAIICNLGILGYFKYTNFVLGNLNEIMTFLHISKQYPLTDTLLTLGISFIIFQSISYTIDIYREIIPVEKNIFKFALYLAFFPKLISGPIERAGDILKQIHNPVPFSLQNLKEGLCLILMGLFYKLVFSDNIAAIINPVFVSYEDYSGIQIALSLILFLLQLYGDFNGYSYIALGSAKALGFQLSNNFEAPFYSESVSEFWRRWHITLNNWFRDYLYIPLGGSRNGTLRTCLNTFIVFLLSGLWHGAEWTYLIWGALNGCYVVAENIEKKLHIQHTKTFSAQIRRKLSTFLLVVFSFLFFRMPDLSSSLDLIWHAVTQPGIRSFFNFNYLNLFPDIQTFTVILIALFIIMGIDTIIYREKKYFTTFFFEQTSAFRWLFGICILCMIIFFGAYGDTYEQTQFIYFQF